MKMLEYETANPGQDFDEHEKEHFDPEKHTTRPPPVVNLQLSSDTLAQDKEGIPDEVKDVIDQEHHDANGLEARPDASITGNGRQLVFKNLMGRRKDKRSSTDQEITRKAAQGNSDIYDAAPGAESGSMPQIRG